MPSRGVRDRSPPGLFASTAAVGVRAVRRGGRTRTAPSGERIGRRSRYSWIVRVKCMAEPIEQAALRARLFVKGKVQGVGYRAFAARVASQRGLCGGVRNLDDGRVELDTVC